MASKENKGGVLTNEQVEQDLKTKGKTAADNEAYTGSQDTGDKNVRQRGTEVQQQDGRPADGKMGNVNAAQFPRSQPLDRHALWSF